MIVEILTAAACLAAIGLLLGAALGFASKVFFVKEDERRAQIIELLPGANCGGCGFAGCANYADAIVNSGEPINRCPSCSSEVLEKISAVTGGKTAQVERKVAHIRCSGGNSIANKKYEYYGMTDCAAAARLLDGFMDCRYGCLGFGTCASVCPYGAISINDGVASVDKKTCVGCGLCVDACPKHVIDIIPANAKIYVQCSNHDKGAVTRQKCASGCLGCKICEKTCGVGAIKVTDNVASIDFALCTECGKCEEKCPKKIIKITQ
ncbi:MAG: RnfABCDGE type electron transport complex subunit B [Clostridia bacterium]|nr:RnfABCDGE type electron transport complex subunit B [Clostridia bacterium]